MIPKELRSRDQWCISGHDKSPYLFSRGRLYRASTTSGPWLDFATVVKLSEYYGLGIGFILTKGDPFVCIDLDVKDCENSLEDSFCTTFDTLEYFSSVVRSCDSYAEISASGKGIHIWLRGNLLCGRRGSGIEVYFDSRFIICTGNSISGVRFHRLNKVVIPIISQSVIKPIVERQQVIDNIISNFTTDPGYNLTELQEVSEELTDDKILLRAREAGNGIKFSELYSGRWQQFDYPSQSEADLALLSMLAFYSASNSQCFRIFRGSVLGEREKATRDDKYLIRSLALIRSRQLREREMDKKAKLLSEKLLRSSNAGHVRHPDSVKSHIAPLVSEMQLSALQHQEMPMGELPPTMVEGLDWPPGLVGSIAGFIYGSAPRPVKEVAITAALGLMAGIVGKAYIIGQTGLNLYIILIARSGVGKEAMHSGIGHILNSGVGMGSEAKSFVDFSDFASGPALVKVLENRHSLVNVAGEFGRKLRRLSLEENSDGPMAQLRTVMTNLYQKSGPSAIVGGLKYSNKDKNIESSSTGVAFSMIGETTPGTFYENITSTMIEDGFLSRFITIEYGGNRPPLNNNQVTVLPETTGKALNKIILSSQQLIQYNQNISVQFDNESNKILERFNLVCDSHINAEDDEAERQMWNRAHLKALRISGILAVCDNYITPMVTKVHTDWALNLVNKDIERMKDKILTGDIGSGDDTRYRKLLMITKDYLSGLTATRSYNINKYMVKDSIITRRYYQLRSYQLTTFKSHRNGSGFTLDKTLEMLIANGNLSEIKKDTLIERFNFHGRAFKVLDLNLD